MRKSLNVNLKVYGFYKYNPAKHQRSPTGVFATINPLAIYSNAGISETHGGTDKWLDTWNIVDGSNNYLYTDDSKAVGTKCIRATVI